MHIDNAQKLVYTAIWLVKVIFRKVCYFAKFFVQKGRFSASFYSYFRAFGAQMKAIIRAERRRIKYPYGEEHPGTLSELAQSAALKQINIMVSMIRSVMDVVKNNIRKWEIGHKIICSLYRNL